MLDMDLVAKVDMQDKLETIMRQGKLIVSIKMHQLEVSQANRRGFMLLEFYNMKAKCTDSRRI